MEKVEEVKEEDEYLYLIRKEEERELTAGRKQLQRNTIEKIIEQ